MSKVLDKPTQDLESERRAVQDHELPPLRTIERPREFEPAPVSPGPSRFIRWMGWVMGLLLVVGLGGFVWWTLAQSEPEPAVPAAIDPHVSPEILHGIWGAGSVGVDPMSLQSLQLLRGLPTQGIDAQSLESLELLRGLPTQGIDAQSLQSLELLRGLPAMVPVEIDPHVSPEVLRGSPLTTPDIGDIDPHVSPEILRSHTPDITPSG